MPASTLILPSTLTSVQRDDARDAHASAVIEGTSLSEAQAMEIAAEVYASGEPERIAALPTRSDMSYEQIVAEWRQAGLLRG
ncbi:MAG TPA: hypothetical protein VGD78_08155 [Chthoniobacterales bacterium]